MAQYPTYTPPKNGWQIAGDAIGDVGKEIGDLSTRQAQMRAQMEEMTQKRAAAILAQRAAEDKARMDEFDYKQKSEQADRDLDFQKFAAGSDMSPSYNPSLSQPAQQPKAPAPDDVADLSNVQGLNMPAQQVSGDSSWNGLNRATDASIQSQPAPRKERTPEELIRYGLQTGNIKNAKEYAEALKALKDKPADAFNDPNLLADFRIRAQDPSFQQIAQGYASNPVKYGPILQNWAVQNGYAGQRWWDAELSRMVHQAPQQQGRTPQFNPQTATAQKFTQENAIHDDYTKATARFDTALPAFAKAQQALQRNNPADAYSAVINFVRTLDPQSTVREAEERLARTSAAGGVLSRWFMMFNQGLVGTLDDDVRRNLYESSKGLLQSEFEQGYTPARNDARSRTLGYPDPTGQAATLDTMNTIGPGREARVNDLMTRDIFTKPTAPAAAPKPAGPPASEHPKASAVQKLAEKILANPKSSAQDKAKATEALRRLNGGK